MSPTTSSARRTRSARTGSRPRWRSAWPAACSALVLAACGGGGDPLAERAEAVAGALERGDTCEADRGADALVAELVEAVNAGELPPARQEEVLSAAQVLAELAGCPRSAPGAEAAARELARLLRDVS